MANLVKFDKDIYVRDGFGVRRRVFVAGQEVEGYVFEAVLKTNKVVNPDDLPQYKNVNEKLKSLHVNKEVSEEPAEPVVKPEAEPKVEPKVKEDTVVKQSKPKRKSK